MRKGRRRTARQHRPEPGVTILKLRDGKIIEEFGLDDGVTALAQLGLLRIV